MKFFYALLATFAIASCAAADDYIVVMFDTSGSMGDWNRAAKKTRMQVAQEALVSVLTKVPPTTKVGLLTFNGWTYPLSPVDNRKLEDAILSCVPGGGTPLYEYIKKGADTLLEQREKNLNVGYYKLIVVTDGEAQDHGLNSDGQFGDGSFKPGYLKDIISRGIVIDAIGLDLKKDHSLKTQINGVYMRGDDPTSVQKSIKAAVAEVGFNGNDALSDEAFKTLEEFPESFVKASLKGLTEFRNQPIGELPMIKVTDENGNVTFVSNPANVKSGGIGFGGWFLIILGVVTVALVIFILCATRR
jgi:hypothetical protein